MSGLKPCAPRRAGHARVAEAVVARALVGVAEDGIRLGRFLEPLFGGGVARIAIGMVLERQLPVRALDVLLAGRAADAQDLVVVAFAHALATLTCAGRSSRDPMR